MLMKSLQHGWRSLHPRRWLPALKRRLKKEVPPVLHRRSGSRWKWSDRWLWGGLVVLCLTSAIGYRFYSDPLLTVGTTAPQTFRAPVSDAVVDTQTTEANRRAAQMGTVPVLQVDPTINQSIYQDLQRWLEAGDRLRRQAGGLPYVSTNALSTPTQRYLRQASQAEWQAMLAQVQADPGNTPLSLPTPNPTPAIAPAAPVNQVVVLELQNYRRSVSAEDFSALQRTIERSRRTYATALQTLSETVGDDQVPPQPASPLQTPGLLDFTNDEWEQLNANIRQALERILSQGIAPGLPTEIQENAIRVQLGDAVPGRELAIAVLQQVLRPNLVQDPQQTRLRAEQAARQVEPVVVRIRRGETIVAAGEPITQEDFVLLDRFGMSQRQINWLGVGAFAALMAGAVVMFLQVERWFHPGLRRRDYVLIVLLTLTTPLLVALKLPTTSLLAVGLLLGSFYGLAIGMTVVGLLGIMLPIGLEIGWPLLLSSGAAGLLAAALAGRTRSREELALLGGATGIAQGAVHLLISLILSAASGLVWQALLWSAMVQGIWGIGWSITALGVSPYLEQVFDLITPIRLAELANPNRPLLKRLAAEAPGTFQHTLFVATLAEAAARKLGCNVELVRAGTLYHDIGKMHDAQGFIENQMGGANKHDLIDDPWKSAAIIKKHVTEGIVMARRYRLPKAIQAFIPEHQGTMAIAYFLHEAKKRLQDNPDLVISDDDFYYDGPIPQSRETGIVMLADSCEAALRSLQDATPEEALAMVNRVLRSRWQEDQLKDAGLSRDDMTAIAEVFVQVWRQFNHKRIAYPKLMPTPQPPVAV